MPTHDRKYKYYCGVIIPTKNAMPQFVRVFESLRRQKLPWRIQITVIDSGSTDGTVEYVNGFNDEDIQLIQIDPKTYGHGRTRNEAIEATDAQYVAVLTHDAVPANDEWLTKLVGPAELNDDVAGVFGRHVAYEDASPFTKQDLDRHFAGFLQHPLVVNKDLYPEKYENDQGWRQFLHFYSDNNSLMRRCVWEEMPYPDVEFAEDQIWAKQMIEAGRSKAYAPDAIVIHSHDYGLTEQLRRAFDEARNFETYFGYRLSETAPRALRSMAGMAYNSLRERVDGQLYGQIVLTDRLSRVANRVALVAGHYLGANHRKLPLQLQRRLSLDKRLFDQ